MDEMPLEVQRMVAKIQKDLRKIYEVKRRKFADKLGLAKSDPIRLGSLPETFCCRCGYWWRRRPASAAEEMPALPIEVLADRTQTGKPPRSAAGNIKTKGAALKLECDPVNQICDERSLHDQSYSKRWPVRR